MPTGKIPTDFPHIAALNAAGVNTFGQLAKFSADYTAIAGIGPVAAEHIKAALAEAPVEATKPVVEDAPIAETVVEPEPVATPPVPCRYQADRDTVVDGEVFGIDAETGIAERVEAIVNGRFVKMLGVRAASVLTAKSNDSVGCYALIE